MSMKVYARDLGKNPVHIKVYRSSHDIDTLESGFSIDKPIYLDMHFQRVKLDILGEGYIKGEIILECSRCLESFVYPIESQIMVRFLPASNLKGKAFMDLAESDLNISYFDGSEIDVDEHIRENIILLLPIKPLCKPDCAGLCPQCGKNLNQEKCSCSRDEAKDPRLSPLRNLLKDI